jgi:UDP-glucose 6-dehydrogenase
MGRLLTGDLVQRMFIRLRWLGTGFVGLVLAAIVAQSLGTLAIADATPTKPKALKTAAVQSTP